MRGFKSVILATALVTNAMPALASGNVATSALEVFDSLLTDKSFVSAESEHVIEAGKLVSVSSAARSFAHAKVTNNSLSFEIHNAKVQTLYRLDEQGNRILPGTVTDITSVTTCRLTERQSSGRLIGICFSETAPGYETVAEITLNETSGVLLTLKEKSAADHVDGYAGSGNGFKPAFLVTETKLIGDNAGLRLESTETGYDVDLRTGIKADRPYASIARSFHLRD